MSKAPPVLHPEKKKQSEAERSSEDLSWVCVGRCNGTRSPVSALQGARASTLTPFDRRTARLNTVSQCFSEEMEEAYLSASAEGLAAPIRKDLSGSAASKVRPDLLNFLVRGGR